MYVLVHRDSNVGPERALWLSAMRKAFIIELVWYLVYIGVW
jgi:hypothetical protein